MHFRHLLRAIRRSLLYRYCPLRQDGHQVDLDRIVGVIARQELYFSSSDGLNDPFECRPAYSAPRKDFDSWIRIKRKEGHFHKDIIDESEERLKTGKVNEEELCNRIKQSMYKHIQEEIGICCFSVKLDSMLMWTHYASSHTGVCFQFLGTPFTDFFGEAQQVRYKDNRPVVNLFDNDRDKQVEAVFLTKNKDWAYEQEFRMVGYWRKPGIHKFPENCLKGVIFGANISKEDESFLRDIIKKSGSKVELYKVSLNEKFYNLNIIPRIKQ